MNARSGLSRGGTVPSTDDPGSVRVWDPIVRLFHWTVVAGCTANLVFETGHKVHRFIGYVVAAAVAIRIVWGFVSHGYARFSGFVPRPETLIAYIRQLYSKSEPRHIGHNPAGSIMIVALLSLLVAVSVTGWMLGLDRYFGNETIEELHEGFAMAIWPLAGIHVLAGVLASIRHRENLIKSMITGKKRRPMGTDVNHAIDSD